MAIISGAGPDPKVREHLEALVVSSDRTSKVSLSISAIAIAVAVASVYFAYADSKYDEEWKRAQLELLEEISGKLSTPNKGGEDSVSEEVQGGAH